MVIILLSLQCTVCFEHGFTNILIALRIFLIPIVLHHIQDRKLLVLRNLCIVYLSIQHDVFVFEITYNDFQIWELLDPQMLVLSPWNNIHNGIERKTNYNEVYWKVFTHILISHSKICNIVNFNLYINLACLSVCLSVCIQ